MKKFIDVFGTTTKSETVSTINDKILPGSLVFEALAPFPGYYDEIVDSVKPLYLYLALEEQYPLIDIMRAVREIEKVSHETFDIGLSFVNIYTDTYAALRVRHLESYDMIEKLQELFQKQELLFLQKTKKGLEEKALIRIFKFFSVVPIDEGIYLDKNEALHAYLEIPEYFNWDAFVDLTNNVKYNWEGSNFDAATGTFYHNHKLHDVIRIYSNRQDAKYLSELRKLYLEKIS